MAVIAGIDNMLDSKVLEAIGLFYSKVKDNVCAIILCGSKTLNYIVNSRDIDILIIAENMDKLHLWVESMRNNESIRRMRKELKEKYNISMMSGTIELFNTRLLYSSYIPYTLLFGNLDINLIDIRAKANEYKEVCKRRFEQCISDYEKDRNLYHLKSFYHIYTGMCMIKNNYVYDLSEDEIVDINILHDCEDEKKILPLVEQIRNWLY